MTVKEIISFSAGSRSANEPAGAHAMGAYTKLCLGRQPWRDSGRELTLETHSYESHFHRSTHGTRFLAPPLDITNVQFLCMSAPYLRCTSIMLSVAHPSCFPLHIREGLNRRICKCGKCPMGRCRSRHFQNCNMSHECQKKTLQYTGPRHNYIYVTCYMLHEVTE